jgi:hypothetical protein
MKKKDSTDSGFTYNGTKRCQKHGKIPLRGELNPISGQISKIDLIACPWCALDSGKPTFVGRSSKRITKTDLEAQGQAKIEGPTIFVK